MNKFIAILFLGIVLMASNACKEVGPIINFEPTIIQAGDTTYVDFVPSKQNRIILLEEFTGIRCSNCPPANDRLKGLLSTYKDNLISVAIHATFFADPLPPSNEDFRTPEGAELAQSFGIGPLPIAMINRKQFPNEVTIPIEQTKWEGYIQSEIQETPLINLYAFVQDYDKNARTFNFQVTAIATEEISDNLNLSIMLYENNIQDYQLGPSDPLPDYNHQHALRDMATTAGGTPLQAPDFQAGRVVIRNFPITLDANWKAEDCYMIAFVHKVGSDKEILQATEIKIE